MAADDFQSLFTWFRQLTQDIRIAGTPAEITSGLACVHHRLADSTKDCDIWIPPTSLAAFKDLIRSRQWQGHSVAYRSALSAPLETRWLDGGWSSHLIWDARPPAKLDIFGKLPRVLQHASGGVFSNEETLARVKMTQRDKDWPTVHELGELLLVNRNPLSLLFLQKSDRLLAAKEIFSEEDWKTQARTRPLLNCPIEATPPQLHAAHLRTEQTFWKQVDHHRVESYRNAARDYSKRTRAEFNAAAPFDEQDKLLTEIAQSCLPTHPLHNQAGAIIETATEDTLANIDRLRFNIFWLPTEWAKATLETCYAPPGLGQPREPQTR